MGGERHKLASQFQFEFIVSAESDPNISPCPFLLWERSEIGSQRTGKAKMVPYIVFWGNVIAGNVMVVQWCFSRQSQKKILESDVGTSKVELLSIYP